ncbi:MAG: acyl-CoA dehydrogenase family protein [Beijerinckiaceae bacterium]|nr:acyl-CoA dehydrogenase family protein [Beijerinckiaceae bacterium]
MVLTRRIFEPEHEMFRDTVRRFLIAEVQPHAERWREQGIVDREAWLKAGEAGLLMLWADEKYGGAGIDDIRYDQVLTEEWMRYGEGGFYVPLHNRIVGPYLNGLGTEEQRARLLPGCVRGETILAIAMSEPSTGSDLSGMTSRAQDKGDHWLLNGAKTYISNGILSDLVIVAAKTDDDNPRSIGLFLVERGMHGFERGKKLKKMGMPAQDTAELFFNNVKVPKANVLGDPARGLQSLMHFLAEERLFGAIRFIALAERAFEVTLEFVQQRKMFGQTLGDYQNTRFAMASMRAELDMAQAFVDHCVEAARDKSLTPEVAAALKLTTSEIQGRVVDQCLQLHGGAGYMAEYEISRIYTDARVSRIFAGSSEVMREIIGRSLGLDGRKAPR